MIHFTPKNLILESTKDKYSNSFSKFSNYIKSFTFWKSKLVECEKYFANNPLLTKRILLILIPIFTFIIVSKINFPLIFKVKTDFNSKIDQNSASSDFDKNSENEIKDVKSPLANMQNGSNELNSWKNNLDEFNEKGNLNNSNTNDVSRYQKELQTQESSLNYDQNSENLIYISEYSDSIESKEKCRKKRIMDNKYSQNEEKEKNKENIVNNLTDSNTSTSQKQLLNESNEKLIPYDTELEASNLNSTVNKTDSQHDLNNSNNFS